LLTSKVTMVWAIALSPLAVLLFFIYARLLGRLGLVLTFAQPEEREAKPVRRKKKRAALAYDHSTRWVGPKEVTPDDPPVHAQPDEMPGIETPFDGPVTGYGVDYEGKLPSPAEPKPALFVV